MSVHSAIPRSAEGVPAGDEEVRRAHDTLALAVVPVRERLLLIGLDG
jgi:hypothetical protein